MIQLTVTYFNAQNVLILNAYLKQPLFDFLWADTKCSIPIITLQLLLLNHLHCCRLMEEGLGQTPSSPDLSVTHKHLAQYIAVNI